jgi:hypothetical protein
MEGHIPYNNRIPCGSAAAREKAATEFDRFSVKKATIRKAGEMREFVQKCEEGRVKYV